MSDALHSTKEFVQVGDPLEDGYFSKLVRVRSLKDGSEFTVKQVELRKLTKKSTTGGKQDKVMVDENQLKEIAEEAKILVTIGHPNLIRVYGSFEEEGLFNIVMDDCKCGTLARVFAKRTSQNRTFSQIELMTLANQILQGINYLHNVKQILHRDIRAENVFLAEKGQVAKLGNFGIVKALTERTNVAKIGAPTHMPPEVLQNKPYDQKSEMWAFGVLLYQVATFSLPFQCVNNNHEDLFKAIQTKKPNELPSVYSAEVRDLIETQLLNKDKTSRPGAAVLLTYALFQKQGLHRTSSQPPLQQISSNNIPEEEIHGLFNDARKGDMTFFEEHIKEHGAESLFKLHDGSGDTLLHAGALYGQYLVVSYLLDKGADINARGYLGRTPLLSAACKGQVKIINLLLSRKADIEARSQPGDDESSAIHLAASFGHIDAVTTLLDAKPESINWRDKDGDQPIHRAALHGHIEIVDLFCKQGCDVESKGQYDRTPLLCAVTKGSLELVTRLINFGASIAATSNQQDGGGSAIHLAAEFHHMEIVSYLLKIHPEFMEMRDANDNLPINAAALSGSGEIVKLLLKKGANIESLGFHGRTPLLNACGKGDAEMVKFLISLRADVSARSGPKDDEAMAIHLAASFGSLDVLNVLLDAFPGFINISNEPGDLPLNVAALNGQNQAVRLLLERNADIEARGYQGRTPLLSAASAGHVSTVELLIDKGAKLTAQTDREFSGDMAIHLAAYFGHIDVVKFLLNLRPQLLTVKNSDGDLPFQRATANSKQAVVDYLLEKRGTVPSK